MKLKTKIAIDRLVGSPLIYILNVMARILGFFLRINHSLDKPFKTIAVCKFVGLGSIIQSTPLLNTLRKNYPGVKIIFITNVSNKTLFSRISCVDEVLTVSDKGIASLLSSTFGLLFKLWKQKPDVYIDLEIYSNYSSMMATLSLSKNRLGYFKNDKMYRKGMYTHMMYFNIKSPISQTYLQFARLLQCKILISELQFDDINENKKNKLTLSISQKLNTDFLNKYIVINPNASDLRLERRWDKDCFVSLINFINHDFPSYKIILVGSKEETIYVDSIFEKLNSKNNILNSAGKLSISELIFFIGNATLMITNDTGPMHIAFAQRTRTVALFGPCSPQQYGGLQNTYILYKNVYCSPCVHEFLIPPCKGNNQCMKKITVEEVFSTVKLALTAPPENKTLTIDYTSENNFPLGVIVR